MFEARIQAACRLNGTTAAFNMQRGCAAAVHNGAGDNSITLDLPAPAAECAFLLSVEGAATGEITLVHTSDTVKQILCWSNVGVAANADFELIVMRVLN